MKCGSSYERYSDCRKDCSKARSGVAVAENDVDQATMIWAEMVKNKEGSVNESGKPEEKQLEADGMGRLRQSMTATLAIKDTDGRDKGCQRKGMIL